MAASKKKSSPLVGIDISSTAVKVVQLSRHGDRYRVDHFGMEPLQPGAVTDKAITETESVGKTIEAALKKAGIRSRSAALAIGGSGTGIITKIIQVSGDLKKMSEDDIQSQVELEASNHIPYPVDEVRMDYMVLGPARTEGFLDVLLAAARNESAIQVQEAAEIANLTVEVLDVEQLAIEKAYSEVAHQLRLSDEDVVALVDIGASMITLNVMRAGRSIFQRQVQFDAKHLEKELVRRMGVSSEEAMLALRNGGYPDEFEEKVLDPYRESLGQHVGRLLQFFYSSSEYNTIGKLLLTGGGANTKGLPENLEDRLGVTVHIANPMASMSLGSGVKGSDLASQAPALFVATGLALRAFEDGVNLMPWREKRRKERHKAVMTLLGLSAAGALAVVVLGWTLQAGQIERQESRNKYLQDEIKEMDKKVEEIQDLDIKRERLLGRKQVIEELQSGRSQMVHLFDELVRTVPDGIQISAIQQTEGYLVIDGRAESNSRVSDYLRRLDASAWLDKPDLQVIEEEGSPGSKTKPTPGSINETLPYLFKIKVTLVNPNQPSEDEDGNPIPPAGEAAAPVVEPSSEAQAPASAEDTVAPSPSPAVPGTEPAQADPVVSPPAPSAGEPASSSSVPGVTSSSAPVPAPAEKNEAEPAPSSASPPAAAPPSPAPASSAEPTVPKES